MFFYLKKAVTPFLLPPGIFILLLLVLGIWFLRTRRSKMGLLQITVGILMWFAALGPLSNFLFKNLEDEYSISQHPKGDVIILLGGGINDTAEDLSGIGTPSTHLLERIVGAVRVYNRIQVPIIASGGSYYDQKISEAEVTKRYLMELGVPENMIIVEVKSRDTIENAKYSKEICDQSGYTSPVLVTSAFHMKRSVMSFRKVGLKVAAFPVGSNYEKEPAFHFRYLLPNSYYGISIALKEYLGRIYYAIAY